MSLLIIPTLATVKRRMRICSLRDGLHIYYVAKNELK